MDNSSTKDTRRIDYIVGKLDPIDSELKSDVILNNALNTLQGKMTKTQLIKSINISVDRWIGIIFTPDSLDLENILQNHF